MKKFLIIFFSIALSFCFICPIYALEPEQDGDTYHFATTYSRPSTSSNSGYIEILYAAKSTGKKFLRIYTWTIYENSEKTETNLESSYTPYMYINLEDDGALTLAPRLSKSNNYAYVNVNCLKVVSNEWDVVLTAPVQSSGSEPSVSFGGTDSNYSILNYQVFGNYYMNNYDLFPNSAYYYTVNYGSETYNYSRYFESIISYFDIFSVDLIDIKQYLNTLDGTQHTIISLLEEIKSYLLSSGDSVDESTEINDSLNDVVTEYEDIEGGFVMNFEDSIGNLPSIDFNAYNDFAPTVQFVSNTMQQIYDSNQYLRLLINACLLIGISLLLIGRGNKK